MFREWLKTHDLRAYDYSGEIFKKASDRAFWDPLYDPDYIKDAEEYLGYEWPLIRATDYIAFRDEGNRVKQEKPHFEKRAALIALLIGELLEYKGRFLPDIIDGLYNICEEANWGFSAHYCHGIHPKLPFGDHYIELFSAETGALLALVDYFLHDELNAIWPESTERTEYNLNERIVKPYLKHRDFWWMGYTRRANNWNPWIISNLLTVFLLTEQPKDVFYAGLEKMLYEIDAVYIYYKDDGGCDEGIEYWALSGGTIFEFCEQLYRATGGAIDFFGDPKIRAISDYPCKTYIGNRCFVNFGDGGCHGMPSSSISYLFGKRTGNQRLVSLGREAIEQRGRALSEIRKFYTKRAIANLIVKKELAGEPPLTPYDEAVLPDIQNAFARNGKWYYAAKGGHNHEFHNHNDVGSFIAFYDCAPVLIDPGCGVYTRQTFSSERYQIWTMRSEWHNTPVINGVQQSDGDAFRADSFSFARKICRIGFAPAYGKEAGLLALNREIAFSDEGLRITDSYAFENRENRITEYFLTPLAARITPEGVLIGEEFLLSAAGEAEITVENRSFEGDEKLIASWGVDSLNRIGFTFSAGTGATAEFRLKVRGVELKPPSAGSFQRFPV